MRSCVKLFAFGSVSLEFKVIVGLYGMIIYCCDLWNDYLVIRFEFVFLMNMLFWLCSLLCIFYVYTISPSIFTYDLLFMYIFLFFHSQAKANSHKKAEAKAHH